MDYSWAMIHSACLAFNRINIASYLDNCWEFVNLNSTKLNFPTVLHLCSAHIMHGLSYKLEKHYKIKNNLKQLILHALGTILKSSRIIEINLVFTSLCYLLSSEFMSSTVNLSLAKFGSIS